MARFLLRQTLILSIEVGRLDHVGREGTLDERGFEQLVSHSGSVEKLLSGALLVFRSNNSPGI